MLPVVAYLDSIVATLLLNDPEAAESDAEVAYPDPLTVSSELLNAEPVTSRADTLVLNDPEAAESEPEVADSDADAATNDPLVTDCDALAAVSIELVDSR